MYKYRINISIYLYFHFTWADVWICHFGKNMNTIQGFVSLDSLLFVIKNKNFYFFIYIYKKLFYIQMNAF